MELNLSDLKKRVEEVVVAVVFHFEVDILVLDHTVHGFESQFI